MTTLGSNSASLLGSHGFAVRAGASVVSAVGGSRSVLARQAVRARALVVSASRDVRIPGGGGGSKWRRASR